MILSIIIPVYNLQDFIIKCLESFVKQDFDFSAYEIIVVDDGSTDNSLKKIADYKESYPLHNINVYSKSNGGLSSARNFGMQKAKGTFIWFVDGDDWVSETSLLEINNIVCQNPLIDIIEFDYELAFYTDVGFIYKYSGNPYSVSETIETGRNFLENHAYSLGVTVKIYRLAFILETNVIFPEGLYNEDNLFSLKTLLQAKNFIKINKVYYYYYQRPNSITKTKTSIHLKKYYKDIFQNMLEMRKVCSTESQKIRSTILRMNNFFILLMMLDLFKNKKFQLLVFFGKKIKEDGFYPLRAINFRYISKKFYVLRFIVNIFIKFL